VTRLILNATGLLFAAAPYVGAAVTLLAAGFGDAQVLSEYMIGAAIGGLLASLQPNPVMTYERLPLRVRSDELLLPIVVAEMAFGVTVYAICIALFSGKLLTGYRAWGITSMVFVTRVYFAALLYQNNSELRYKLAFSVYMIIRFVLTAIILLPRQHVGRSTFIAAWSVDMVLQMSPAVLSWKSIQMYVELRARKAGARLAALAEYVAAQATILADAPFSYLDRLFLARHLSPTEFVAFSLIRRVPQILGGLTITLESRVVFGRSHGTLTERYFPMFAVAATFCMWCYTLHTSILLPSRLQFTASDCLAICVLSVVAVSTAQVTARSQFLLSPKDLLLLACVTGGVYFAALGGYGHFVGFSRGWSAALIILIPLVLSYGWRCLLLLRNPSLGSGAG
jgi:hypothetical protein